MRTSPRVAGVSIALLLLGACGGGGNSSAGGGTATPAPVAVYTAPA
jgi:hypothetical protein